MTDEQIDEVVQKRFGNMNVKFKLHFRRAVRDCLSASIADTAGAKAAGEIAASTGSMGGGVLVWLTKVDELPIGTRFYAATPAPSVADAAGASRSLGKWTITKPTNDGSCGYTTYETDDAKEARDAGMQGWGVAQHFELSQGEADAAKQKMLNLMRQEPDDVDITAGFDQCTVPPTGWYCTREAGHEGPCAAVADAAGASEDAQDAARWRHLRNCGVIVDFTHAGPWKFTDDADAAVDKLMARSAAINAASASKTTERKKLCTGSHIMCEGREYCLGHPSCNDLAKESGND